MPFISEPEKTRFDSPLPSVQEYGGTKEYRGMMIRRDESRLPTVCVSTDQ